MVEFTVTGFAELGARLRAAGPKLAAQALEPGLRAGGAVLRDAVEARTPVDTGLLKSSIQMKVGVSDSKMSGRAAVGFGRQGNVARLVEFGHRTRAAASAGKKSSGGGHVPAHPFLRPAMEEAAPAAVEAFLEVVETTLPDVLAGRAGND